MTVAKRPVFFFIVRTDEEGSVVVYKFCAN